MKMILPSLSVNEGTARLAVAAFCAQADPLASELVDLKCAVSEAVTNCIVHAYRDTVGDILLHIRLLADRRIQITVKDTGCGIADVAAARQPLYTTDTEGERSGMGFTVMESFCDGVRVSSTVGRGTRVVLYKQLKQRSDRAIPT